MRLIHVAAALVGLTLAACSGGGDGGVTQPPPNPTIVLTLDRSSESAIPGASFTINGTLTRGGGYTGTVNFTITGVPSGVTASPGNVQTTGAMTTLAIAVEVGASVAPGVYPVTATGQGAGVTPATAQFTLTVLPTPDFSVSVNPASATIVQGNSRNDLAITLGRTNYEGAVALGLAGSVPAGVSASFAPGAPTAGSSTMALSVAGSTAPGTYTLTIQGSGAPGTRTATFTLTVDPVPDFTVAIAQTAISIVQGRSRGDIGITIGRTNFTGAVALALAGQVPIGLSATFQPASATGNGSLMTLTVAATTPVGSYNLRVDGTGAPGTRGAAFTLTVTAPGSFTLALTPTNAVTVQQGTVDNSLSVTITRTNYTSAITLTAEDLPAGMTATFTPNPATGSSAVLTLTVTTAVPVTVMPYAIRIRGSGPEAFTRGAAVAAPAVEATTTVMVTVTLAGSFTVSISPTCGPFEVPKGSMNDSRSIDIVRTNFPAALRLSVEGLPPGVTALFWNPSTTANSEYLALFAEETATAGLYNATVRVSSPAGDITTTVPIAFTVVAGAPLSPDVMTYTFDDDFEGWIPGTVCAWLSPGTWGKAGAQQEMLYLDGVGHPGRQNTWIAKVLQLPADATTIEIDASGHPFVGADAKMRVRVIDGTTSTMITEQVVPGSASGFVFTTRTANIAPWAGKRVRIIIEQDANGYQNMGFDSAEQLWITAVRIR